MTRAAGLIEVYGLVAAFAAADAACKAADVTVEAFDRNKPAGAEKLPVPLIIVVKLRGALSDVQAAMQAAENALQTQGGVISARILSQPDPETEQILAINAIG